MIRAAQLALALVVACDGGTLKIDDRAPQLVDTDRGRPNDDTDPRHETDRDDSAPRIETAAGGPTVIEHVCQGETNNLHTWPITQPTNGWPMFGVWQIDADGGAVWQAPRLDADGHPVTLCQCVSAGPAGGSCTPVRAVLVLL